MGLSLKHKCDRNDWASCPVLTALSGYKYKDFTPGERFRETPPVLSTEPLRRGIADIWRLPPVFFEA